MSSSSTSSSTSPQWEHDVFVSFKKDDQRETFISDLFRRLKHVGISYFGDDKRDIEAKPPEEIPKVRFALIVLSTNYVDSKPCLKELVKILNCKRHPELVVIPIFYRAKVSEVASNRNYNQALREVPEEERWRSALANGLANGNDLKLIDIIVERLVKGINSLYPTKDFGPFGGNGKTTWKSGDIINGIEICYANFINSIAFEVDEDTSSKPQNDGKSPFKVKLENGECISSFAGYCDHAGNRINSLTFRTNKRIWGPFGREEGEYFSVPSKAGKVTSFFGTGNGEFLGSIGARVELNSKELYRVQSVGYIGLEGKRNWDDGRTHANVRKIDVVLDSSRFIRSIEFTYEEKNGRLGKSKTHGSNTGGDVKTITIDCRDEYLTSISGYYTEAGITSLTFRTNKQKTSPIGEEKGIYFSSPAMAGKIVGFYGYIDEHLCGIGAYFEPISDLRLVKSVGPFGGGCPWDDGKFDGVREIHPFVKSGTHYIRGIKFVYDDGSAKGHTVTHGNCTKGVSLVGKLVLLDYPREFLTSISGYTQEDGSIWSLTFHSNRKIHGPYGKAEGEGAGNGEYFGYPSTGSRIIGFYGTWGKTLNSIGVYVEPIPHLYPFKLFRPPIEGSGGTSWDDGVHTNVRGFRVTYNEDSRIIESITFKYDDNGSLVEGSRHGGGGAGNWEMLNFPEERLTRIKGCMLEDSRLRQTIIHSLTIYTTKRRGYYGPYAQRAEPDKAKSKHFVIPEDGTIVGFFGTAKEHLNSIGARLEPY